MIKQIFITIISLTTTILAAHAQQERKVETEDGNAGTHRQKPSPADTPPSQMEKLDRGLIVMPTDTAGIYFASWRFMGTDTPATTFTLLRNGTPYKENIKGATSCHVCSTPADRWQVVTLNDNAPVDTSDTATPWADVYMKLKLDRPTTPGNRPKYIPNDCSVGDVDGDGKYEIIVKWEARSADNSHRGITDNVILDCYKLNGTRLWRIDLGPNIRSGAHYTQFMVYDFDGNGKAEMICKTATGSKDAQGRYVTTAADDPRIKALGNDNIYRNSDGHILKGAELLTVFNGTDGKAIHTIWYNPNREGGINSIGQYPTDKQFWGDIYGNRSERYLACVAYLDGPDKNASAIMCRGYYTRAYLWAVDFDGSRLKTKWMHASTSNTNVDVYDAQWHKTSTTHTTNTSGKGPHFTAYANGNHNLSVADVDGDGCDEILYGACAINNDGSLLYSTGMGHGDAMHVGDLDPDRPGYEVFTVHEEGINPYGYDMHDAATGEILHERPDVEDTGRGLAGNFSPDIRGALFAFSGDRRMFNCKGQPIGPMAAQGVRMPRLNFRIYWDGDEYEEIFDGRFSQRHRTHTPAIFKWNNGQMTELGVGSHSISDLNSPASCNYTKATPCLQVDLFGDWREEIIMWSLNDGCTLNIYSTQIPTPYRVPTLMHDHVYRMGICWQNTAYNQPPHLGYYLPENK